MIIKNKYVGNNIAGKSLLFRKMKGTLRLKKVLKIYTKNLFLLMSFIQQKLRKMIMGLQKLYMNLTRIGV